MDNRKPPLSRGLVFYQVNGGALVNSSVRLRGSGGGPYSSSSNRSLFPIWPSRCGYTAHRSEAETRSLVCLASLCPPGPFDAHDIAAARPAADEAVFSPHIQSPLPGVVFLHNGAGQVEMLHMPRGYIPEGLCNIRLGDALTESNDLVDEGAGNMPGSQLLDQVLHVCGHGIFPVCPVSCPPGADCCPPRRFRYSLLNLLYLYCITCEGNCNCGFPTNNHCATRTNLCYTCGMASKYEDQLYDALREELTARDLPLPERPVSRRQFGPDARLKLDFAWPLLMYCVEIDGGNWRALAHTRAADYKRRRAITENPWRCYPYHADEIRDELARVVDEIVKQVSARQGFIDQWQESAQQSASHRMN